MKIVGLLFFSGILFFTGCGKKIDATSEKKMQKSIESIVKSMTAEESTQFKKDCVAVVLFNLEENEEAYKILHGKTPKEVRTMANEIREKLRLIEEQRKAEEIATIKTQIEELTQIELENIENQKELARVIITEARFARVEDGFLERPIISFHINNTTEEIISRIDCEAELKSTGRKVAWVKDKFYYSFKGGLNPGESQKLVLTPNMFSDWGDLKNRDDYILTITIKGLRDENEEPLWDIRDDVSKDIERLQQKLDDLENTK